MEQLNVVLLSMKPGGGEKLNASGSVTWCSLGRCRARALASHRDFSGESYEGVLKSSCKCQIQFSTRRPGTLWNSRRLFVTRVRPRLLA